VFARDWHPKDHCNFSDESEFVDGSWPAHCVQHSPDAEFVDDITAPLNAIVVDKGCDEDAEQYSTFEGTGLAETLLEKDVTRVFVGWLVTDYCVKFTTLGGRENGFDVVLIEDACRAVDNPPGSEQEALDEMRNAGVAFCQT
jgi:nicotinamidase/pyrazinamidase